VTTHGQHRKASGPRAGFWRRFGASLIDGIILGVVNGALTAGLKATGYALGLLISLAYYTYMEGRPEGQTLGKMALGIRVISLADGAAIGFGRAAVRWIGRFVSSVVILLGYLWMLWDPEKQTWHDKFAGSVVVPVADYPVT
jgi:uncharacterized RDD family membrane protein YckC